MSLLSDKKKINTITIIIVVIVFILIVILKVFTGPPPPGTSNWKESFSRKPNLPEQIKQHPIESKQLKNSVTETFSELSSDEIDLLNTLSQKAISLLPSDESKILIDLQSRFNEGGYDVLNKKEIVIMQELNKKAISLLPENEQNTLYKIFEKNSKITYLKLLKSLVNNLDHEDESVRWQSIVELEKYGSQAKGVIHDILPYLRSDDWKVRYYSAEILGTIGPESKEAISELKKLSNDPNEMVRNKVSWAIKNILNEN